MPGQVKAIIPPKFNEKAVWDTLETELEKYAPFLIADFERTTSHWKGVKPNFVKVMRRNGDQEMILQIRVVGPEEGRKKWKWLNEGTDPHVIRPKGKGYPLRFRTGYQAGSKPKQTYTIGAYTTGPEVAAMHVNHPGFPAREWSDLIVRDHQKSFESWMAAAMGHAAKASGHEI